MTALADPCVVFTQRVHQPRATKHGDGPRLVATSETTDGEFGLFEIEIGAGAGTARPHYHTGFTESFYILAGSVRLRPAPKSASREPATSRSSPATPCTASSTVATTNQRACSSCSPQASHGRTTSVRLPSCTATTTIRRPVRSTPSPSAMTRSTSEAVMTHDPSNRALRWRHRNRATQPARTV